MARFGIHSRRTVTQRGIKDATIVVSDGVIVEVIDGTPDPFGDELVDVGDSVLMPGIIDPHVHINEPGRTEWEGFDTATRAALAGGITTLVDMPLNSSPVTTSVNAFHEKIRAAQTHLHTNCGFWGGVVPGNENDIEPLIAAGVLGFKAFLIDSGIDEFPSVSEHDLRKAIPLIAKHHLPLLVHCELTADPHSRRGGIYSRPDSYQAYMNSRPRQWENDAIALMIRLCEEFNCRTHIVHVSSSDALKQIAKAKQQGLPITAETAQHYLFFSAEEIADGQTQFKCAPPIREGSNNEKLWEGLKNGILDFVATDHSPSLPEMKELQSGDFRKAWGGITSIQFALPALWTAAKKHHCEITDIAKWLCERPAPFIGAKKKGRIEKGYNADLVVWSPEDHFIVNGSMIYHRHHITPYLHKELFGVVKQTYLHGELVFDNGNFLHLNKGKLMIN
ncbi:MAG TPA: allantoinase AllB [Saprospiraceae bacterium]|nr:allantoinase AllB [Saprospiraceae bacterium]